MTQEGELEDGKEVHSWENKMPSAKVNALPHFHTESLLLDSLLLLLSIKERVPVTQNKMHFDGLWDWERLRNGRSCLGGLCGHH